LVDTSSETTLKYIKTVLLNVDKIIFLIEPSLLEIKKAENLLEIYIEDWEIPVNKFKIILNKVNINSIDEEIIKNMFNKIEIVGKLSFSSHYTAFSNDVRKECLMYNKYMKILEKI
jgi:Flp pilus assembly CpaE family ATPase